MNPQYYCDRCAEELPKRYACLVIGSNVESSKGLQKMAELCQPCADLLYAEATAVIRRAGNEVPPEDHQTTKIRGG